MVVPRIQKRHQYDGAFFCVDGFVLYGSEETLMAFGYFLPSLPPY